MVTISDNKNRKIYKFSGSPDEPMLRMICDVNKESFQKKAYEDRQQVIYTVLQNVDTNLSNGKILYFWKGFKIEFGVS